MLKNILRTITDKFVYIILLQLGMILRLIRVDVNVHSEVRNGRKQ